MLITTARPRVLLIDAMGMLCGEPLVPAIFSSFSRLAWFIV